MKPYPLLALLLISLTGCAGSTKPSGMPSTAPTPRVACNAHTPFEALPPYPQPTPVESAAQLAARGAPSGDYAAALTALGDYSNEQALWSIQAAGVTQRERAKRAATAHCLDAFRVGGVIK